VKILRQDESNHGRPLSEGLTANIVQFGRVLKENGIPVSFSSVLDVLRGIHLIDISQINEFYHLLRFNLVSRKEDLKAFEGLFNEFWFDKAGAPSEIPYMPEAPGEEGNSQESLGKRVFDPQSTGESGTDLVGEMSLRYSPHPFHRGLPKERLDFVESPAFYESINKLLHPITNRLSRRYQYTIHGKEISLRKILRKNMQFGGELILLDYSFTRSKGRTAKRRSSSSPQNSPGRPPFLTWKASPPSLPGFRRLSRIGKGVRELATA
jgi:uncharacterized protein with von Willebrand factor type A (vWA) domain